jgi:hypothetical protein
MLIRVTILIRRFAPSNDTGLSGKFAIRTLIADRIRGRTGRDHPGIFLDCEVRTPCADILDSINLWNPDPDRILSILMAGSKLEIIYSLNIL